MSEPTAEKTQAVILQQKARAIDRIATEAMALFEGSSSFESELAVAQAVRDLRAALTPEIMAPIMALMNTEIGFLTDQDPLKPSSKNPHPQPYSVDVVRECFIESKLRGFHSVGNEWNIIAKKFYAAKNGLKRRCETWKGLTNLKIVTGLPRINGDSATVAIYGEWKLGGVKDEMVAPGGKPLEVLIRVNNFMGADAVVGKAERKLYKRIFDRLSGRVTPDGEIDDPKELLSANHGALGASASGQSPAPSDRLAAGPTTPQTGPGRRGPTLVEEPLSADEKAEADAGLAPVAKESPPKGNGERSGTAPAVTPVNAGGDAKSAPAAGRPSLSAAQERLAGLLAENGFNFRDLCKAGPDLIGAGNKRSGDVFWESYDGIEDFPEKACQFFIIARDGMLEQLKAEKGASR